MNGEILGVMRSFKSLGSYVSCDGALRENVRMRVDEGLKTFGAMKMMFVLRSVSVYVNKELHERGLRSDPITDLQNFF